MARNVLMIGNSDGIGAAVTSALLARGDRIVGISRSARPAGIDGARHEIEDVTSPRFPDLVRRLAGEDGPFDACIYCAGVGSRLAVPDFSREAHVFEVNLTGMVRTLEALAPGWVAKGAGHFIGLSSLADDIYNPDFPSYSASKAGVSSYLLSMGLLLRRHGVSVTNVRFGFVDTKMARAGYRPLMMTRERAARHVLWCLEHRPLQLSAPKLAGLFIHAVRLAQSVRIWTA